MRSSVVSVAVSFCANDEKTKTTAAERNPKMYRFVLLFMIFPFRFKITRLCFPIGVRSIPRNICDREQTLTQFPIFGVHIYVRTGETKGVPTKKDEDLE